MATAPLLLDLSWGRLPLPPLPHKTRRGEKQPPPPAPLGTPGIRLSGECLAGGPLLAGPMRSSTRRPSESGRGVGEQRVPRPALLGHLLPLPRQTSALLLQPCPPQPPQAGPAQTPTPPPRSAGALATPRSWLQAAPPPPFSPPGGHAGQLGRAGGGAFPLPGQAPPCPLSFQRCPGAAQRPWRGVRPGGVRG